MFENNNQNHSVRQNPNYYPTKPFIKQRKSFNEEANLHPSRDEIIQNENKNSIKQYKRGTFDQIKTPEFSQRYEMFIPTMSEYQSSSGVNNIIQNSRNRSSAIEMVQSLEDYPNFTQKLTINFQRNLLKMMITKIKNDVHELKQLKSSFYQYIKGVQSLIQYFKEKISIEIQEYFKKYPQSQHHGAPGTSFKALELNYQQLFQENKMYINNLQNLLDKKNEEINKIQYKLQQQLQKNKILPTSASSRQPYPILSQLKTNCYNCQVLTLKLNTLKSENDDLKSQVNKLIQQNQIIYQQKFDFEQRIAGIDLQVQKRLKQQMKMIVLPIDRVTIQKQNEQYLFVINKLNEQNSNLQKKINYLQNLTIKQLQLKQKQKLFLQKQQNLRLKEDGLLQSIYNNQKIQQKLFRKQNEILIAEQNIKNVIDKINNNSDRIINKKQQKYYKQSISIPESKRHSNVVIKDKQFKQYMVYPESKRNSNVYKDKLNLSGQSLQSFGNHKVKINDKSIIYNHKMVNNASEQPHMHILQNYKSQQIEIPMLALNQQHNRSYQYEHLSQTNFQDSFQAKLSKIPLVQAEELKLTGYTPTAQKYNAKNSHHDSIANKYLPSQVTHHKNSTRMHTNPYIKQYHEVNIQSQPSIRNYNLKVSNYGQTLPKRSSPSHSPINYREASKNSRASSNKKSFGNYLSNSQLSRMHGKGHQKPAGSANILGSKLQKLREQIKREIDSIN